jgi:transcriptional regulator with XRE-family HTH domain
MTTAKSVGSVMTVRVRNTGLTVQGVRGRISVPFVGNNVDMGIGARIRAERQRKKIGPAEFAKRVGLAKSTLMDLERGESKSSTKLHKIATELNVTPVWLEAGRGPKHPEGFSAGGSGAELSPTVHASPSHGVRPDPAMLASAYQWALIGIQTYAPGQALRMALASDAAIVCDPVRRDRGSRRDSSRWRRVARTSRGNRAAVWSRGGVTNGKPGHRAKEHGKR